MRRSNSSGTGPSITARSHSEGLELFHDVMIIEQIDEPVAAELAGERQPGWPSLLRVHDAHPVLPALPGRTLYSRLLALVVKAPATSAENASAAATNADWPTPVLWFFPASYVVFARA